MPIYKCQISSLVKIERARNFDFLHRFRSFKHEQAGALEQQARLNLRAGATQVKRNEQGYGAVQMASHWLVLYVHAYVNLVGCWNKLLGFKALLW